MSEPSPKDAARRDRLEILDLAPHHVLATWRNVGIALWIDDTPVAAVESAQAMLSRMASEQPGGVGFLQVVCEGCQQLDNEARAAIQTLLRSGRGYIREAPVVFEGNGFRAATVRAIVAGIAAISNHGFPHRVYSTVAIATEALARNIERREPAGFARALATAVADARVKHRLHFPRSDSMRPRGSWRPKANDFFRNS
ncbi:MAG: hypothetical protein JWN48_3315 [Myxococcaceae bacterium]|nr:hypothetical protein [Myxococcaceae bacterium]